MPEDVVKQLTTEDREAVREAMEAVVGRDVDRVRALLADPESAADFWMWADDYGREGRLSLLMPPGPVERWQVAGVVLGDGSGVALDVPMWATSGRTDLTLQLELTRDDAGRARVELQGVHAL